MSKAYLLTGEPRVGKTTALKRMVGAIGVERCGGFYTEEIRVQGVRVGFRLVTLDGQKGLFAHIDAKSPIRHGRYGLNVACLEALGVAAIYEAMAAKKLIVIDEIGPMELHSPRFKQAVMDVLRSSQPLLCTIALKADSWLDAIKRSTDIELCRLTLENRDTLMNTIADRLKLALTGTFME